MSSSVSQFWWSCGIFRPSFSPEPKHRLPERVEVGDDHPGSRRGHPSQRAEGGPDVGQLAEQVGGHHVIEGLGGLEGLGVVDAELQTRVASQLGTAPAPPGPSPARSPRPSHAKAPAPPAGRRCRSPPRAPRRPFGTMKETSAADVVVVGAAPSEPARPLGRHPIEVGPLLGLGSHRGSSPRTWT